MLPYWILFGTFAAGALTARVYQRQERALMLLFAAFMMLLMIGLRFRVGVDWSNYVVIWEQAQRLSLGRFLGTHNDDPAFYILTWTLRWLGLPFWILNLLCAAVFTYGLLRFARLQPNPWLAIAVAVPYLVIVIAMSGIRQATAIGFVFLALVEFIERRPARFLAWLALGAAFHASAIVVLGIVGLSFAKNRFQAGLLLMMAVVIAYFALGTTFAEYSNEYLRRATVQSSGTFFRLAMAVVAAILYFIFRRRFAFTPDEHTLWRNFSLFALAAIPLVYVVPSTTAVDRILLYSYPLQITVLSHVPYAISRDQLQRMISMLPILAYLAAIMIVFFSYGVNRHPYVPYRMYPFADEVSRGAKT